jgi:hypothetical protein
MAEINDSFAGSFPLTAQYAAGNKTGAARDVSGALLEESGSSWIPRTDI